MVSFAAPRLTPDIKLGMGVPMSVNAGINGDDYKMEGLSAKQWVRILGRVGREGVMSKMDYEAAYKHIQVGW